MKLLFITNTVQTMSGASKIIRFVAGEMANEYDDVSLLSIVDREILNSVENCTMYTLQCSIRGKLQWRFFALMKIRTFVRNMKPDVICSFVSDACFLVRLATLGLPVKLISCDRGDPSSYGVIWSKLAGWAYRHSDVCVFQLCQVRDYFGEKCLKKSFVIPNPFVPAETVAVPFEKRKKTIVSAGRLEDQKGYDLLIKAFKSVHEQHPDYSLIIYGDGALRNELTELIRELELEKCVHLPGFANNVSEQINDAGIFCLPSRFEGIPNALLEAMSLGIPTVSADCSPGGARFLTDDGRRGLLVPKEDDKALAEALNRLIENKVLAKRIGEEGKNVRELFSPKRIAALWREVFDYMM